LEVMAPLIRGRNSCKGEMLDLTMRQDKRFFIVTSLAPALIVLALITILPFVMNIFNSLKDYYLVRPGYPPFVGLENFRRILFYDPTFWKSLLITLAFTGGSTAITFWLGLLIAGLLSPGGVLRNFVRAVMLLPMAATPVAVAFTWRIMYSPSLGIINYLLGSLGLPQSEWIGSPKTALLSVILVDVWQWTPFMTLIMLAGLMSLPQEPFEAAVIDGAGGWQIFRFVTLPLVKPVAMTALLFRVIDSLKTFDIIFVLTRGGPGNATETLNLHTYLKGFSYLRIGEASALAVIMLALVFILSQLFLALSKLEFGGEQRW